MVRVYIAGIKKERRLKINKNKEMDVAELRQRFQDKDCVLNNTRERTAEVV